MSNIAVKAKGKKKHNIPGYLFILPSVLFFLFYILYPIGFVGWSSLFSWSTLKNMTFVGMENYIRIFQDKVFLTTMRNSLFWIITTVPIQAGVGFFLAYIIEEQLQKGKGTLYGRDGRQSETLEGLCNRDRTGYDHPYQYTACY